ncbi:MAG TPA: hypothetical protein VF978_08595 [Gemmatimonadales bacterium]
MTGRDRRAVILGLAVIAAAGIVRVAPRLYGAGRARVAHAEQAAALAAAAAALAAESAALRDTLTARAGAMVRLAPALVAGETAPQANAELSAFVSGTALTHRVAIHRIAPAPDSVAGPLRRVEVRVSGEGDLDGIVRFIRAVEGSPQLLSLSHLVIEADGEMTDVQRLRFEAAVRGWSLRGEDD